MRYTLNNLLKFPVVNDMHHEFLCNEVVEIEMIMALHSDYDEGNLSKEKSLDVAFKRMRKEIQLKERHSIPIWHDAPLEWFHASYELLCEEYL